MASTALASPALARDNSWYIGAEFGPMLSEDLDFSVKNADGDEVDTVSLDTDYGYDGGGYVGYDFGAFRLEAEVSYREADLDTVTTGPTGLAFGNGRNAPSGQLNATGGVDALSFMSVVLTSARMTAFSSTLVVVSVLRARMSKLVFSMAVALRSMTPAVTSHGSFLLA